MSKRPFVDLHLHSTYSDGTDTPAEVAARAHALGAVGFALTDHDTTAGLPEAAAAADALGIGFLSGVELSCRHDEMGIHVLGYGFDPSNDTLQGALKQLNEGRGKRSAAILTALAAHGIVLEPEELGELPEGASLTRMHIAKALKARGVVSTVQRAFDQFLNPGRPAWVKPDFITVVEGIAALHAAGGLAFLAHPYLNTRVKRNVESILEMPFDGVEVWHTEHSREASQRLHILAHDRGLLVSGGSDCHGMAKGKRVMGGVRTSFNAWEAIQERIAKRG